LQGTPTLANHTNHPKADSTGAGSSKPSRLKGNHRKGRGLRKAKAPTQRDGEFLLKFNTTTKSKEYIF